jgi:hypothetical protein
VSDDWNLYAYTSGNPLGRRDATGESWQEKVLCAGALADAALMFGSAIAECSITGKYDMQDKYGNSYARCILSKFLAFERAKNYFSIGASLIGWGCCGKVVLNRVRPAVEEAGEVLQKRASLVRLAKDVEQRLSQLDAEANQIQN